jgi:hypothetical protein
MVSGQNTFLSFISQICIGLHELWRKTCLITLLGVLLLRQYGMEFVVITHTALAQ